MTSGYLSLAGRHVLQRVRSRLGFSLVIVGAGIAVGAVSRSSAVSVIAVVGIGTLIVGLIPSRGRRGQPQLPSGRRRRGQPFSWTFTLPTMTLEAAVDCLARVKLSLNERSDSHARLSGGSQLRLRLLGGYFIDPVHLPIVATVKITEPEQDVEVSVQDRLGSIGVRDKNLESRYALRVEQIRSALETT